MIWGVLMGVIPHLQTPGIASKEMGLEESAPTAEKDAYHFPNLLRLKNQDLQGKGLEPMCLTRPSGGSYDQAV